MADRFVSGGTLEKPLERDEEWHQVEKELEDRRREKATMYTNHDGKSLYEVLQANKGTQPSISLVNNITDIATFSGQTRSF
jgi:hypothetical protein